ncbi:MAG: hypothetical protein M0R28_16315 [Pigmentiphaga sp.]|nr:hypothetical protein [Pigmentiphaga sp.]
MRTAAFVTSPASGITATAAIQKLPVERLPFTVRVVDDPSSLGKAVRLRQTAYGRHVPELARQLHQPEPHDFAPGVAVLLAESKLDGEPLGTMRIQTNIHAPLWLEQSVTLPEYLQQSTLAEATRLGVMPGSAGRLAKTAIFKAYYLYCVRQQIDYMAIAGRSPLDRQYLALLFHDVFPERGFIPMRHAGNIPHRVLAFEVATARKRWQEAGHPLFQFVFGTHHPDIRIDVGPGTRATGRRGAELPVPAAPTW